MADPRLDQVNIVVSDLGRSADFYAALGLDLGGTGTVWDDHHRDHHAEEGADVDLDSPAFAAVWCEGWPTDATGVVMNFRVDERPDVDRLHDELVARGGRSLQSPVDAFWGSRFAVVADPDGQAIGVMSVRDPAFRTAPPEPPS